MSIKITPTSDEKESEGTWTKYLNVDLKIARSTKPKYIAEMARRMKVFKNAGRRSRDMSTDEITHETCKALSAHILLDWKNFPGDIQYSRENAFELLKNDPDCRDFVIEYADDAGNFYEEETEEIVGKS